MEFTDAEMLTIHKVTKLVIDKSAIELTSMLLDLCSKKKVGPDDETLLELDQAKKRIDELEVALQQSQETIQKQNEQRKNDLKRTFRLLDQIERTVKSQRRGKTA